MRYESCDYLKTSSVNTFINSCLLENVATAIISANFKSISDASVLSLLSISLTHPPTVYLNESKLLDAFVFLIAIYIISWMKSLAGTISLEELPNASLYLVRKPTLFPFRNENVSSTNSIRSDSAN